MRAKTIDRLKSEFGEAQSMWTVGDQIDYRWSLSRSAHAPLNIAINNFLTPQTCRVWLFDPADPDKAVTMVPINAEPEIEGLIGIIRKRIDKSSELQTTSSSNRLRHGD